MRQACCHSCAERIAPRLPAGCVVVVSLPSDTEVSSKRGESSCGDRRLSWSNRRLSKSDARPAQGDGHCSEYKDHKDRKPYRIFADHTGQFTDLRLSQHGPIGPISDGARYNSEANTNIYRGLSKPPRFFDFRDRFLWVRYSTEYRIGNRSLSVVTGHM